MKSDRVLLTLALGLILVQAGCLRKQAVRDDIIRDRARRFVQWRTEAGGHEAVRPLLHGPLSLEQAIHTALVNSRQVEIGLLARDKARARLLEAYSAASPRLDADFTYTRIEEPVYVGQEDNYALTGTATQPLYRGGLISAGVRAAGVFSMLTDEQLRGTRQNVIFSARKAYYDVRLAIELEKASADAVTVAQRLLEDTRKGFDAGTVSSFDVLRAEVELKSLIAQNVANQNRVHLTMTTLYNVLGVSQESHVELTDALAYAPLTPVLEEAVHTAFLQNTAILQSELTIRLQKEAVAAAQSGYYPELDAFFQEAYARPDPRNVLHDEWNDVWTAGLTLRYTLFEGFRTVALVRQAESDYAQSKVGLRDTEESVLLALKQALFSLDDAAKAVISQQANVEQATEAQRLVELGFREGIRKQVEVLDARRALTTAQAQYAEAVYAHEVSRLAYEQSVGILDPIAPGFVRYPTAMELQSAAPALDAARQ